MTTSAGLVRAGAMALLAAAVTVGATRATGPLQLAAPHERAGVAEASDVLVEESTLVCPGQQRIGTDGLRDVEGTLVAAVASPPAEALEGLAGAAPAGAGAVALMSGPSTTPLAEGTGRTTTIRASVGSADPVMARARGALAPGLVATQVWQHGKDDDRGVAVTPCQLPASDAWLVGGGGGPSRTERLVVANPGANAVTVSFDVYGSQGPVPGGEGRTVSVAPLSRAVVSLDALAPDETSPVVHVVATGGVVTAVLDDAWIDGATARGLDDATRSSPPDTDLVIAGLDVAGAASVRLANPGRDEALVQVRALTPKGPIQPSELRAVRVPAGSTVDIPLGLPAGPAGLRVLSDHPIVAGAWTERRAADGDDRMGDFGWAPATPALRGIGGVLLSGLDRPDQTRSLLLAAGAIGGTVEVTTATGGIMRTRSTAVGPDSAAYLPLGDADGVWVRVASGDVRAAVSVSGSEGDVPWFSIAAITAAPVTALSVPVRQVGS
jgi:hypothetical protein